MTTMQLTASSAAYLLTAALAARRDDEAAGLWRDLDDSAQVEVITALGAQARVAVREAGVPFGADFTELGDAICAEARIAVRLAYEDTGAWRAPQCSHCRELAAAALAEIHLKAGIAAGAPASHVERICRGAAMS